LRRGDRSPLAAALVLFHFAQDFAGARFGALAERENPSRRR
jgi:hypothetical protein